MRLARRHCAGWLLLGLLSNSACQREPEFPPDELLQSQLGLTERDEVRTVTITGGGAERPDPRSLTIEPGAYVQFVTGDWLIHEVIFEADSLGAIGLEFMTRNDQLTSPPLMHRDSRFVVSFVDAPMGRYPYRLEGNGDPSGGVIIVSDPDELKR